jgi:hypothetical protein
MASCKCQGGVCEHHAASQPCPNRAMEAIARVVDLETGTPIDSAHALCRECWENQAADYYEQ